MWSAATLKLEATDQVRALLADIVRLSMARVQEFKPQEMSHLLWGLAELGMELDAGVLDVFAVRLEQLTSQTKFQEVAGVLQAWDVLNYHPGSSCLEVFCRETLAVLKEQKASEAIALALALARLGHYPGVMVA